MNPNESFELLTSSITQKKPKYSKNCILARRNSLRTFKEYDPEAEELHLRFQLNEDFYNPNSPLLIPKPKKTKKTPKKCKDFLPKPCVVLLTEVIILLLFFLVFRKFMGVGEENLKIEYIF